jgi:hypothetical protein
VYPGLAQQPLDASLRGRLPVAILCGGVLVQVLRQRPLLDEQQPFRSCQLSVVRGQLSVVG